jgi:hypothetical protein
MEFLVDKTVKLFNGAVVSWDEFSGWSSHRQRMNLTPTSEGVSYGPDHCHKMREIVIRSYLEGTRRTNWNYGAKNGQAKAVMTPDGEFPTRSAACSHYKVSRDKFRKWMRDLPKDFFFVNPDDVDAKKVKGRRLKAVSTPDGIFPSINSAARHFNVGARTIKTWVRKMRADEFKYVVNSSSSD